MTMRRYIGYSNCHACKKGEEEEGREGEEEEGGGGRREGE